MLQSIFYFSLFLCLLFRFVCYSVFCALSTIILYCLILVLVCRINVLIIWSLFGGSSLAVLDDPGSEGWPHHGRTFSIHPCPLSFWLTLPRRVLSASWCCPSRPCVVFLACVHLVLFLALSLSPGNSLVSSWCVCMFHINCHILLRDATHPRYQPWACVRLSVSVCHKSVFYRNRWTNRAGFWHISFLPPVIHCVKRKFGYLQKWGHCRLV